MSPIISGGVGGGSLSGVTVTGVAASGQVPVATNSSAGTWKYPPGFEIGYDPVTADVTVASTTEATGTALVTCAAHTFDGGAVLARFYSPLLSMSDQLNNVVAVSLFEGATEIGILCQTQTSGTSGTVPAMPGITGMLRFTPTAASHTYKVTAFANIVAGTPFIFRGAAGGTSTRVPMFVQFTKV